VNDAAQLYTFSRHICRDILPPSARSTDQPGARVRPCGVKRAEAKNGGKLCEHDDVDVTQASRAPIKLPPSLRK